MSIGVGVIGCGRWGQHYLRIFSELPSCEVMAMNDSDLEQLTSMHNGYPDAEAIVEAHQVFTLDGVDAVVIATPASTHYRLVKEALHAGKHVLVEKPFVLGVEEGEELVELAEKLGRMLMVGHVFLYNPGIRKLKEYMSGPDNLGDVYYLYAARTNLGPIRQDVNVIWDLAPHDISIFSYLLGRKPLYVNAVGSRFLHNGLEDVAFITLTYPGGVVGHIHVSWANPHRVRQIAVVGSRKRLVFDDLDTLEKVRIYEKGVEYSRSDRGDFSDFILSIRDGNILSPVVEAGEPLKEQCIDFIRSIQTKIPPAANARQGLEGVRVLTAIQRSLEAEGARVKVA
jgi:predicted dehydrogenase